MSGPPYRRRVLVAVSDDAGAALRVEQLEGQGYEVVWAGDGEEAWTCISHGSYCAVIADGDLPGLSGIELLERIRESERDSYTYVILIGNDADSIEHGMQAGADDFLVEPVEEARLMARLRVAERISGMQEEIVRRQERLVSANRRLEISNERIHDELRAAARVQQALLPSLDMTVPGLEIGWRLRPCAELAGDLLNCMRLDEHHLAFYVLDVSGHGVSSALMSVQVSRLMSPTISESELLKQRLKEPPWYRVVEPAEVLRRLNEMFTTSADSSQYFTIIYGTLHLATGYIRFATAGHPGPVHVPADGVPELIPCRSRPVGLFDEPMFQAHELTLEPGDRLWLYSDGVTDVTDSREQMLGPEGLRERVAEQRGRPVRRAVHEVMTAVEQWSRPALPDDDCTLLAIEGLAAGPGRHGG